MGELTDESIERVITFYTHSFFGVNILHLFYYDYLHRMPLLYPHKWLSSGIIDFLWIQRAVQSILLRMKIPKYFCHFTAYTGMKCLWCGKYNRWPSLFLRTTSQIPFHCGVMSTIIFCISRSIYLSLGRFQMINFIPWAFSRTSSFNVTINSIKRIWTRGGQEGLSYWICNPLYHKKFIWKFI